MVENDIGLIGNGTRGNWLRLRTLVRVRWIAIAGQIVALVVAQRLYLLQLEVGLCYLAVGLAIIVNLIALFVFPESKRLSEFQNFLIFLFDLLQLCFLLFLTGGLNNPFSILVIGPVTVSASILSVRSTVMLGAVAIALVSLMVEYHLPLRTELGYTLQIPQLFVYGNWVAIVIAILFLSTYSRRAVTEMRAMTEALAATQMALAREQKLTDLGGVVAAAAHELGTPLATIKLASSELVEELSDNDDLREDAELIRDQADRCRDILHSMGRAGKDDLHLRKTPLTALLEEAAEPHMERGKSIDIVTMPDAVDPVPDVLRRPEIIHGLRNIIQNAVDFAQSRVCIELGWTPEQVSVRIIDDGRGFPAHLLGRIGDPLVHRRRSEAPRDPRPEYDGMGLGLFISKTLLERSGAELSFANGSGRAPRRKGGAPSTGAVVEMIWPRASIDAAEAGHTGALGDNPLIAT